MFKKMMLVGSMALAALAFALPVSAASANWIDAETGEPIAANANITFTGPAGFKLKSGTTGADANLDISVTLEKGTTTGKVTSFKDTNCKGKGAFAGLTCTGTPVGLPWNVTKVGDQITIENFELDTHYYSPLDPTHTSPVATSVLKGDLWATPDEPFAISLVQLSNDGAVTFNGNPVLFQGVLNVTPAGTYGTT